MTLDEYAKSITERGIDVTDAILSVYARNLRSLTIGVNSHPGLKADLVLKKPGSDLDMVRFAAFANDLTTISLGRDEDTLAMSWFTPEGMKQFDVREIKIQATADQLENLRYEDGTYRLMPGFLMPNGDRAQEVLREISPLVERGIVVPRPTRIVAAMKSTEPSGRNSWEVTAVDPSSAAEDWSVEPVASGNTPLRAVEGDPDRTDEERKFQLTFPFLAGVSFADLARILDDEQHHIAKARVAVAKLVEEQKRDGREAARFLSEEVRPELDALSRKFDHLAKSRLLRTSAVSLGVVTMTLVAGATTGIGGALVAAGGATGLGLILKERVDGSDKVFEAKEHPLYLLWRLRREARRP